jgi:hypothetical protein
MGATVQHISVEAYTKLLEKSYIQISSNENQKSQRIFRAVYIILLVLCYFLARNFPPYREILGAAMLLIGIFLLTSSARARIKQNQVKKIKQPFEWMLYQITDIKEFEFFCAKEALNITLYKKDESKRKLSYTYDQITSYQWLGGAFLISNQESIDFIIPEGLFENDICRDAHDKIRQSFVK